MVTFNNELDIARSSVSGWSRKELLKEITIIRDVFGRLSFLIDSDIFPDDTQREELEQLFRNHLGNYYTGKTYWIQMPPKKRKYLEPMFDLLKEERAEWISEENITYYLSERPIAKKAWAVCNMEQDAVWPYEDALSGEKPKVITFYSFKGGMGRTTTLASVALQLVRKKKNVMMIDMDIEAPGLATLFFDDDFITNGVLDYLLEHAVQGNTDIRDYVKDVTEASLLEEQDGRLYVLPAGKVDENYIQKLARIDYQDHREGALRESMCDMLGAICESYSVDYILIDSRAGFHDLGGIAVAQLPHGAVLFGNDSRQSWDGMTQVIRTISKTREDSIPILIVDCMCDNSTSPSFMPAKDHFTRKAYMVCMENYYTEGEAVPGIEAGNEAHSPVFLPYDEALRREITLYSTGSAEEDERVRAFSKRLTEDSYRLVTSRIEAWFGEGELV